MLAAPRPQDVCGFGEPGLQAWNEHLPKDRRTTLACSVMAITLNPSDGIPRRVPKLAVRNRDSEHSASSADFRQHDRNSTAERQSSCETLLHPALRPKSASTRSTNSAVTATPRSEKTQSEAECASIKVLIKRKSKGVLGFLALKEPSHSAFEEFAEQEEKKLASQKGPKVLRGVSSQKLPQHVPKVNSKWDGLPESTRRSMMAKDGSARHSVMSLVSNRSGTSNRDSVLSNGPSFPVSPRPRRSNEKHHSLVAATQTRDGVNRPSACDSEDSGSFYSFSSHPETPPELESSAYSNLGAMPATSDSSPRTSNLESSMGAPNSPSRGRLFCNRWPEKTDDRPIQNSDVRDFSHVSKHREKILPSRSQVRSKAAPVVTPHGSASSAKDVAPWEAFEPPIDLAQPPLHVSKSNNSSAGHKFSQRFGAKLGFK
ncbi:hypothetical protein BST61_g9513 [Cercospora zeina]